MRWRLLAVPDPQIEGNTHLHPGQSRPLSVSEAHENRLWFKANSPGLVDLALDFIP